MAKHAMPVSKATNAYELLDEIAALITEEPRRYSQAEWKVIISASFPVELVPVCQTVCCIAGWVDTLKNPLPVPPKEVVYGQWVNGDFGNVGNSAMGILGLSVQQAQELFDGDAAGGRSDDWTLDGDELDDYGDITDRSLQEHADRGAKHIRRFMADNEAQLKAKRV